MRVQVSQEQMREAFETVRDDPSFAESRALFQKTGKPAEMIQALCLRPEILRAFAGFSTCLYPGGLLERRLKELVIVESSRANACQFCRDVHVAVSRMLGLSEDALRLLETPGDMTERERLAVAYTQAAMADANRVSDGVFERLRAAFADAEIVELTFLIGYINMLNLFNNCLRVAYHGEFESAAKGGAP